MRTSSLVLVATGVLALVEACAPRHDHARATVEGVVRVVFDREVDSSTSGHTFRLDAAWVSGGTVFDPLLGGVAPGACAARSSSTVTALLTGTPAQVPPALQLVTPAGAFSFPASGAGTFAFDSSAQNFVTGAHYTIGAAVAGGDVGVFSKAFTAPGGIAMTLPTGAAISVSLATGMSIAWTSSGASDPVYAAFVNSGRYLLCEFADSGSGVVTPVELATLGTGSGSFELFKATEVEFEPGTRVLFQNIFRRAATFQ